MPNFCSATVIGHVGRDAEVKHLANDKTVAEFSIAYTRKGKDGDQTTWFRCSAWGKTAEIAEKYVKKGTAIQVVGEIGLREYQAKDGTTKSTLDMSVQSITLLGGKQSESSEKTAEKVDEDLPF